MKIVDKRTTKMGSWSLTRLYVRENDHGIERLKVAVWKLRRRFEPESKAIAFFTFADMLNYMNKQDNKNLRRK